MEQRKKNKQTEKELDKESERRKLEKNNEVRNGMEEK
jgi:hypothetical protein